ncbi:DUF2155 domain-containing protein [Komagataeibacter rhaeticus]|nr:DUF2155 domain-containing protein [Komagataeibacter rhaeticus]
MRLPAFCLPALVLATLPGAAHAAEWLAPPAMYPPDTWQGRTVAVVRVLDKLDAHVQQVEIPVGQDVPYKSLTLHATSCLQRPATLAADSAAWLEVHDAHEGMAAFQGWMAIAEPSTGVFQNPLYDVQLASCGGCGRPVPPPLSVAAAQAPATAPLLAPMARARRPCPMAACRPCPARPRRVGHRRPSRRLSRARFPRRCPCPRPTRPMRGCPADAALENSLIYIVSMLQVCTARFRACAFPSFAGG